MTAPWPNACDCHMHIYDESYPLAASGRIGGYLPTENRTESLTA